VVYASQPPGAQTPVEGNGLFSGKASHDCGTGTGWDPRNHDLAPPFANLNHQRKAQKAAWSNWHISQCERPVGCSPRNHQRRSRGGSIAAIARNARCKRRHRCVRHVNEPVVDGNLTARIVDGSGDRGGAAVGASDLVALEVDAACVWARASIAAIATGACVTRKTALPVHANIAASAIGVGLASFCDLSAVTSGQDGRDECTTHHVERLFMAGLRSTPLKRCRLFQSDK
jgi:hypothetical protein